jgi:hypothetical protein
MVSRLLAGQSDNLLAKEIHDNLRAREAEQSKFAGKSPFLARRHAIVEWINDLGAAFHQSPSTIHLAVHLIDRLMDETTSKWPEVSCMRLSLTFVPMAAHTHPLLSRQ